MITVSEVVGSDGAAIEHLLDLSFGLSRRAKTSYRLREGSQAVQGLSFVVRDAEIGLAGAISYWPLKIGDAGASALLLGPLAVHPNRQNLGIGLALMRESLARAKAKGHRLVILVGDLPYYGRVGFAMVPAGRLVLPGYADPERLLFLELEAGAFSGVSGLVLAPHRWTEVPDVRA
jgi:predicted N-acetyltransferase YhbS